MLDHVISQGTGCLTMTDAEFAAMAATTEADNSTWRAVAARLVEEVKAQRDAMARQPLSVGLTDTERGALESAFAPLKGKGVVRADVIARFVRHAINIVPRLAFKMNGGEDG